MKDRWFGPFWGLAFTALVVIAFQGILGAHISDERDMYKDKFLQAQNNYEGTRDQLENAERDLADRDERLAQAAERERAAKVRASRSRQVRPSAGNEPRTVDVDGPRRDSGSLFGSATHDITMYCPTGSRTASGKIPRRGMVATISRSIPFGTHILIEGLGEYVVEDRIGHGSEFDIFTPSCAEADRFGRQRHRVTILDTD